MRSVNQSLLSLVRIPIDICSVGKASGDRFVVEMSGDSAAGHSTRRFSQFTSK